MVETHHTVMREEFSLVNARAYGPTRTSATIQAALTAIGPDTCTLVLMEEEGGEWVIDTDVMIPNNVTLSVPSGVHVIGAGALTILGGFLAWRHDWYQGTGVVSWAGSVLPTLSARVVSQTVSMGALLGNQLSLQAAPETAVWTLTWPDAPGTVGQVLSTTGGGTLAWLTLVGLLGGLTPRGAVWASSATTLASTPALTNGQLLVGATGQDPRVGTITSTGAIITTLGPGTIVLSLADAGITYAKLQPVTDQRLLGRAAGSAGPAQELTVGAGLQLTGGQLVLAGGALSGTGKLDHLPLWDSPATLGFDDGVLLYDRTLHRLQIGSATTGGGLVLLPRAETPQLWLDNINAQRQVTSLIAENGSVYFTSRTPTASQRATAGITLARRTFTAVPGSSNDATEGVGLWLTAWHEGLGESAPLYLGSRFWNVADPTVTIARHHVGIAGPADLRSTLRIVPTVPVGGDNSHAIEIVAPVDYSGGAMASTYGVVVRDVPVNASFTRSAYYSDMSSGTGKYGLNFPGTAQNYLNGPLGIGVNASGYALNVEGQGRIVTLSVPTALAVAWGYQPAWYLSTSNLFVGNNIHVSTTSYLGGRVTGGQGFLVENFAGETAVAYAGYVAAAGGGNRWNLHMAGDAPNYIVGSTDIRNGLRVGPNGIANEGALVNTGNISVGTAYQGYWLQAGNVWSGAQVYAVGQVNADSLNTRAGGQFGWVVGIVWGPQSGYYLTTPNLYTGGITCSGVTASGDSYFPAHTGMGAAPVPGQYHLNAGYTQLLTVTVTGTSMFIGETGFGGYGPTTGYSIRAGSIYPDNIRCNYIGASGDVDFGNNFKLRCYGNMYIDGTPYAPASGPWVAYSDARLKHNIHPIVGALDLLTRLRGVYYEWNDTADGKPEGVQMGVIGQEVEAVLPAWVGERKGYKTAFLGRFEALAIEAVKALVARVATLEQRLEALEAR